MPDSKAMTIDPAAVDARAARQARRRSGLRRNSAAICLMLLVQYGLGIFSGAAFVSSDQAGASMAMAVLTGVALLCYLANLLLVGPEYSGTENRLAAEIGRAAEIRE